MALKRQILHANTAQRHQAARPRLRKRPAPRCNASDFDRNRHGKGHALFPIQQPPRKRVLCRDRLAVKTGIGQDIRAWVFRLRPNRIKRADADVVCLFGLGPPVKAALDLRLCARQSVRLLPRNGDKTRAEDQRPYGQAASGGIDIRTASILWPVSSPNFVPRS